MTSPPQALSEFRHLKHNVYVSRKVEKVDWDDIPVCVCKPRWRVERCAPGGGTAAPRKGSAKAAAAKAAVKAAAEADEDSEEEAAVGQAGAELVGCDERSNCVNRGMFVECDPRRCPVVLAGGVCLNTQIQKQSVASVCVRRAEGRGHGLHARKLVISTPCRSLRGRARAVLKMPRRHSEKPVRFQSCSEDAATAF